MEQIQFDKKYYKEVESYLKKNYKFKKESKMVGLVYENNKGNLLFLQKREDLKEYEHTKYLHFIVINKDHPDFNKIKTDLGELTKEN